MKNVFLPTFNHRSLMGITDIIDMLTYIFKLRDINLVVVDELQIGETNILIEDFSFIKNIDTIQKFKKINHPNSKVICVITEFPDSFYGDHTFNPPRDFPYNLILYLDIKIYKSRNSLKLFYQVLSTLFCIPFIPANFLLMLPQVKKNFISASPVANVRGNHAQAITILGIFNKLIHLKSVFFRKLKSVIFLLTNPPRRCYHRLKYIRFHNFIKVSDSFDNIVSMHPASNVKNIWNSFNLSIDNYFTPEVSAHDFNNSLDKTSHNIVFSGNLTAFRTRVIRSINKKILNSGYSIKYFNYSDKLRENLFAFTLCIRQFNDWKHSSPGRIWRAYSLENSIPILVDKFNDHPIEDICLANIFQLDLSKICYDDLINSYISYSAFAEKNNNDVIGLLA